MEEPVEAQRISSIISRFVSILNDTASCKACNTLKLHILQPHASFRGPSDSLNARQYRCPETMASMMDISLDTAGAYSRTILKIYDCRIGSSFRRCCSEFIPFANEANIAFQSFLQSGAMGPFLRTLVNEEGDINSKTCRRTASQIRGDTDGTAKFEAALWRNANEHCKNEVQAYNHLRQVQGVLVP